MQMFCPGGHGPQSIATQSPGRPSASVQPTSSSQSAQDTTVSVTHAVVFSTDVTQMPHSQFSAGF